MGTPGKTACDGWHRLVLLTLLLWPAAYAQSDTAWLFRYPGTGKGNYQPLTAFVDDTCNVYVVGWAGEEDSVSTFLIKIDSTGRLPWARSNDSVLAVGAVRGTNGNIYISGAATHGRICLLAYAPDGNLEWIRFYAEKGRAISALGSIAIDDSQNVYTCGVASFGSGDGAAVRIVTWRPDGDMASARCYSLSKDLSLNDGEFHILGDGDAYLVLSVEHPARYNDWLIAKLSREGQVRWEKIYKDTGDKWEHPRWSQVDDKANIYITGEVVTAAQKLAFCTMKVDSSGRIVWVREYERPEHPDSDDPPRFLKLSDGNVYIVAGSDGITLVKYDSAGDQAWVSRRSGYELGYGWDGIEDAPRFCCMNVDSAGNVYLTGSGLNRDRYFAALMKFDTQGHCVWMRTRPEQDDAWWTGVTVGLDRNGALYDVGTYGTSGQRWNGIYVLKYRTR